MPKANITDSNLAKLRGDADKEANYADNRLPGFILRVSRAGAQTFILRYSSPVTGKQRRWTLGSVAKMTAARARQMAADALEGLRRGIDPQGDPTPPAAVWTCEDLIDRYEAEQDRLLAQGELAPTTVYHRKGLLRRVIRPALGDTPVNEVTLDMVERAVRSVDGNYQQNRCLQLLGAWQNNWARIRPKMTYAPSVPFLR